MVRIIFLLVFCFQGCSKEKFASLKPVASVDLEKYQGQWYQIAHIPNWFQKLCIAETKAIYKLEDDSLMSVENSCLTKYHEVKTNKGRARINPKYAESSRLSVTFMKIFSWWGWFFSGDYWVIYLDKDYRTSIVASPKGYAWVLSKQKKLSHKNLKALKKILKWQGIDPCLLEVTQKGSLKDKNLCQVR